tara:strand:+ start:2354 stop:3859 length:1506 start_codon:yes stop_codon:yes gene_type:complete
MSTHRSYFSKNNTIIANSHTNTAKNPVTQLFYGKSPVPTCVFTGYSGDSCNNQSGFTSAVTEGFSRFIFDLDLTDLKQKVNNCCIELSASGTTHCLKMTNTSSFDDKLLNDKVLVTDTRRATSFDLILFRANSGHSWDEGVGYDYLIPDGMFEPEFDITHSTRPSHWFSATTLAGWTYGGTYLNTLPTSFTILDTQHFDNGNENINFCSQLLKDEINFLMTGSTSLTSGTTYGIAFSGAYENITGITESYSVGFFSRYTQTFFEPFLETLWDDYVVDNRNNFNLFKLNRLFLYVSDHNGQPLCLDNTPTCIIYDCNGNAVTTLIPTKLTCGVYYIELTITSLPSSQTTPVLYEDIWSNISINGVSQPNVTNEFVIYDNAFSIGPTAAQPKIYGYSVSGIKEDEKITNGETRKVFISTRVPYTTDQQVLVDNLQYRVYVTQGTTQVEVIPWNQVNMGNEHNYFLVDTSWMIPNEYYLDIKATSNQQVDTYRKAIKFQIINQL